MSKQKLLVVLVLLPVVCSLFFSVGSVSAYDLELDDYAHYKVIAYEAGVGAGTDYQVVVVCHYGTGTDGTMSLNGETVALLHVGDIQADFDDVRFANQFGELLTFKRCSYVSAVNATFVVKVEANLDVDQLVYVYFGNLAAVDASSNNALISIVSGVVLGLPINEGTGATCEDYSGNNLDGTITGGATWITTGKYGNALTLNSVTSGVVTVNDNALLDLTTEISVVLCTKWVNTELPGFQKESAYYLYHDGTQTIYGRAYSHASINDGGNNVDNGWHNIGYTYKRNATQTLHADGGTLKSSVTADTAIDTNNNNLKIGYLLAAFRNMSVSTFIVFNTQLTEAQMNIITGLSSYPDVRLVAGSVLVRKWATTTLPVVAGVSDAVDNSAFSPVVDGALTDTEWFISGLLLVLALANVVLLAFPFALLRFVFGVLSFALSAWAFTYGGLPLAPYLQIMGLVVSVVCMFLATRARE